MDARSGASAEAPGAGGATGRTAERGPISPRHALAADFAACRAATLALFRCIEPALFRRQIDPGFSPLGWHLGHIAYTEALWLNEGAATTPALARAFAVDGLSKAERTGIPDANETTAYLAAVRTETLRRLADPAFSLDERVWRFVLQHEAQHAETASVLLAVATARAGGDVTPDTRAIETVRVRGGAAVIGLDGPAALDNERPAHQREIPDFAISPAPVTEAQFAAFMQDGGYRRAELWSAQGWAWLQESRVDKPFHWQGRGDAPVCGVSAHEADAFCRWAGARLPTEFEWEHAARAAVESGADAVRHDAGWGFLGTVWQWTASTFAAYPRFELWPYPGYSAAWFDGRHRVLRGGSWATRVSAMRPSFRNWYHPETRLIFAGFRCARNAT